MSWVGGSRQRCIAIGACLPWLSQASIHHLLMAPLADSQPPREACSNHQGSDLAILVAILLAILVDGARHTPPDSHHLTLPIKPCCEPGCVRREKCV
jgi:hypothetical protein